MARRPIVVAISICVHALVLFALMTADLWRPISGWPTPRTAMAFETPRQVHFEDIQLPPAAGRKQSEPAPAAAATAPVELAPLSSPAGVSPETSGERSLANLPRGPASNSGDLGAIGVVSMPPPPPMPLPTAPRTPVRLSSGIRPPQRLNDVRPVYPALARETHVQGIVILEIVIDERGNVSHADVLRSKPLLDVAALDAVRQWKFTPTLLNGIAVPIVMTVTVNFSLQ
jgi:protein TonB